MQTFLPYEDYRLSAQALDYRRLGKQRVETLQILQVLLGERLITSDKVIDSKGKTKRIPREKNQWEREPLLKLGWSHHPAVLMWRNHEKELLRYQTAICEEWTNRGYRDSCLEKSVFLLEPHLHELKGDEPSWLGNEKFHKAHRSNLKRKDESFYGKIWPELSIDLPYQWPTAGEAS